MKMDWFVASLGAMDAELTTEHRALALIKAEEFLKVGRLTPSDWSMLSDDSKEIFLDAQDRLDSVNVRAIAEGVRLLLDMNGIE